MTETDTSREAVETLLQFIDHNKAYVELEDVDKEAYEQSEAMLRALLARAERAEAENKRLRTGLSARDMNIARRAYNLGRNDESAGYVALDPRVILTKTYAALEGADR